MPDVIDIPRGSYEPVRAYFRQSDGTSIYDLTNHVVMMTVGRKKDGSDEVFRLSSADPSQCTINLATGVATFVFEEETTQDVAFGSYWYDVWVRYPDGNVRRWGEPSRLEISSRVADLEIVPVIPAP